MMLYETFYEEFEVKVLYEGDNLPCMVSVRFVPADVMMLDDVFDNARIASANLRDTIGLLASVTILKRWKIDSSDLWDLNHSNANYICSKGK